MSFLAVIGTAFAITFLAELPDKSMFASLVLGTRYRAAWVWAGAAAAFAQPGSERRDGGRGQRSAP